LYYLSNWLKKLEYREITKYHKYDEPNNIGCTQRMNIIFNGSLHGTPIKREFKCWFLHSLYKGFLLVALIVVYWMITDARMLLVSSNANAGGFSTRKNSFMSIHLCLLPLAVNIMLFILIVAVLAENTNMLLIAITLISSFILLE
jgi:hypothetical protein